MLDVERIKSRRESAGMSYADAAERAGFTNRQQWYNIESGRQINIKLETLNGLAKALDCHPKELLK